MDICAPESVWIEQGSTADLVKSSLFRDRAPLNDSTQTIQIFSLFCAWKCKGQSTTSTKMLVLFFGMLKRASGGGRCGQAWAIAHT